MASDTEKQAVQGLILESMETPEKVLHSLWTSALSLLKTTTTHGIGTQECKCLSG